jgi:uncharacterized protein (TIGR03086 family)
MTDELVGRHRSACAGFSTAADAIRADSWALPTPCTEWDARALVEHVIGFHDFLLLRPLGVRANRPRDDPAARWRATTVALFACLDEPGALDRPTELPGGGHSSARQMVAALTTEVFVHTWDLARAAGVEPPVDDDLYAAAVEAAKANDLRRSDGMIGPEVEAPVGADPATQLAAFYGRAPAGYPVLMGPRARNGRVFPSEPESHSAPMADSGRAGDPGGVVRHGRHAARARARRRDPA